MKKIFFYIALVVFAHAQSGVTVFGLRVFGNNDEYNPPVILTNQVITIEFDVATPLPPNLKIIFRHTSKDWVDDENLMVNDPAKTESNYLAYTVAPNGVHSYTYRFRNSFPNDRNLVDFEYSGNYSFTVVDKDAGDAPLAHGKFIVAQNIVPATMTIKNVILPSLSSPWNQVNYIAVDVSASDAYQANDPNSLIHSDITTVDIIQNWKIAQPYRIDVNHRDPDTFVEHYYLPHKLFWIRDIPTGNEYRRLDLSDATAYPNYQLAVLRNGPDVSRFQWQGEPDANGASKLRPFIGANSEYLDVQLNLRLPTVPAKKVFAVGGFSDWEVRPAYEMHIDTVTGLFRVQFSVRRGVYDYQYVLSEMKGGQPENEDWISLEGNDWRTINRYIALVYYRDERFGGFDRIVGIVHGRSPGGGLDKSVSFSKNGVMLVPVNDRGASIKSRSDQ